MDETGVSGGAKAAPYCSRTKPYFIYLLPFCSFVLPSCSPVLLLTHVHPSSQVRQWQALYIGSMLCDVCKRTLNEKLPWPKPQEPFQEPFTLSSNKARIHHVDAKSFHRSVLSGCYLCNTFFEQSGFRHYNRERHYDEESLKTFKIPHKSFSLLLIELNLEKPLVTFVGLSPSGWVRIGFELRRYVFAALKRRRVFETRNDFKASKIELAVSKCWYNDCQNSHQCLPARDISFAPSRLMKLFDDKWCVVPKAQYDRDQQLEYGTVSHRWTQEMPLQLTASNYSDLQKPQSQSCLPENFFKAVEIARHLGIEFLWIDSLCIIQQGPEKTQDWKREGLLMQDIYRNSILNLVIEPTIASPGSESQEDRGKLRPPETCQLRWKGRWWRYLTRVGGFGGRTLILPYEISVANLWDSSIYNSELSARGWIFQELILSPRILHVYSDQLFWECTRLKACEWFPVGDTSLDGGRVKASLQTLLSDDGSAAREARELLNQLDWIYEGNPSLEERFRFMDQLRDANRIKRAWYEAWGQLVQNYTSCGTTYPEDKLTAFAGIAKLLSSTYSGDYFAGMFERSLPQGLLWFRDQGQSSLEVPKYYRAPTWSWASVDGKVSFNDDFAIKSEADVLEIADVSMKNVPEKGGFDIVTVEEVSTEPLDQGPFGPVSDGNLVLKGPLLLVEFPAGGSDTPMEGYDSLPRVEATDEGTVFDRPEQDTKERRVYVPVNMKQAIDPVARTVSGLILVPVGDRDSLQFHRIGVFRCRTETLKTPGGRRLLQPVSNSSIIIETEESTHRGLNTNRGLKIWKGLRNNQITIY